MAYEWVHGFSQCWPPGSKCEVWWDAWAVVVATLALLVASLTTAVTAISAVAVFMLGRSANRLASASDRRDEELRWREARVLAGYLLPELRQTVSAVGRVVGVLTRLRAKEYVTSTERETLRQLLEAQQMPLSASVMARLHVLPADACDNITDALANVSLALKAAKGFEQPRGSTEDDLYMVIVEMHAQKALDALTTAVVEVHSILGIGK